MSSDNDRLHYEELTSENKREIVRGNILQLETEHYALALRLTAYHGATDVTEEAKREMIQQTEDRLASLESAIQVYKEELAKLG